MITREMLKHRPPYVIDLTGKSSEEVEGITIPIGERFRIHDKVFIVKESNSNVCEDDCPFNKNLPGFGCDMAPACSDNGRTDKKSVSFELYTD